MKPEAKHKKLDYKWVIAASCFLMIFVTLGFCSSPQSLYLDVVAGHMGVDRSLFSLNSTFRYIATAIANIFFGVLIKKLGVRKLIILGFLFLSFSMITYALANSLVVFYIAGMLLGIGFSFTGTTMVGCVINRWYSKDRGKIMGAILAANGLGGAIAIQILAPIIESGEKSYKNAYFIAGLAVLVTGIVVAIFMREAPKENNEPRVDAPKKKKRSDRWCGVEFFKISRMTIFYLSLVCIFLTGFCLQGITGIAKAHMRDVGLSTVYVAYAMSFHSISLAVFKFLTGIIYDKTGLRITMSICSVTASAVMLLLAFVTNSAIGMAIAMIYSIFSALALPLETIMLPIYAGDLFGDRAYEQVLGIFVSVNVAGYAIGTPAVNLCYDELGTYKPALIVCAIIMAIVTVVMQIVASKAHKLREEISAT
jgi:MFS family permease